MKPVVSLLAFSAVGLSIVFADASQASNAETSLLAQMRSPRGMRDNDREPREPVDRSQIKDESGKNTWIPVGFNENGVASLWIRTSTYEPLNENSFRFQAKFTLDNGVQAEGRVDMNCKNKDFYSRLNGVLAQNQPWAVIPRGSGIESVAKLYCKRTAAKADWGYTSETAYLWDAPIPTISPDMASGEWINNYDKPDGQSYYNDGVEKTGDVVTFAFFYRTLKGDMSKKNQDVARYEWLRASCKRNIASTYVQIDRSVPGVWMPPEPGSPGGAIMIVRKKFCK
ncbi:hypothetical protein [Synechococcus sp. N5]|uniref:hypothetical protein n=1 Tax=Synechococcus sp. N5 TaxID=2575515 RepID=UPI0010BCFEFB|nr:hypothetical protein [Synechococcus sp. N5]